MGVLDQPPGEYANDLLATATIGQSARYRAGKLAEAYYESRQFAGLREWTAAGPLHKKRPREVVPLLKQTVEAVNRFVWSGNRFPRVIFGATVEEGQSTGEVGPLLNEQQAQDLTTFAGRLLKAAQVDRCAVEYSRRALITGSAAVIVGTAGGHLTYHVEPGYHCAPEFDPASPRRVKRLEVVYQFEREERVGSVVVKKLYWFRRVVDERTDTVYKPVEVRLGVDPTWTVDDAASVTHGLGFCPVKWVRVFPASGAVDGQPLVDPSLYALINRICYVLSQRGRAVEYGCDPQWVRRNVSRAAREELQKNPGKVWDIEDVDKDRPTEIKLLETQGAGADAAARYLSDLLAEFRDAVGVVRPSAEHLRGAVSGVVLEYLHAPMIALASDLRKDLGEDGLGDLVNLCLRVAYAEVKAGRDLWVPGVKQAVKLMDQAQLAGPWLDFPVKLVWGRFFSPTSQDVLQTVQAAQAAKAAELVAQGSATRLVSDLFSVVDVDAEVDQIGDEADEKRQQQVDQAAAMAAAAPPAAPAAGGPPKPGKQGPPPAKAKKKPNAAPRAPGRG